MNDHVYLQKKDDFEGISKAFQGFRDTQNNIMALLHNRVCTFRADKATVRILYLQIIKKHLLSNRIHSSIDFGQNLHKIVHSFIYPCS